MNWLLFIIVVGVNGPYIGFNGEPAAATSEPEICEVLGRGFANALNAAARVDGDPLTFHFRCVYSPPGAPA